jgi:hypothetical protein
MYKRLDRNDKLIKKKEEEENTNSIIYQFVEYFK